MGMSNADANNIAKEIVLEMIKAGKVSSAPGSSDAKTAAAYQADHVSTLHGKLFAYFKGVENNVS